VVQFFKGRKGGWSGRMGKQPKEGSRGWSPKGKEKKGAIKFAEASYNTKR